MAILEVKKLVKSFGSLCVLDGIDFSLEKGESLAIIGSSGSGKTTLLRCLNFLERADGGTISVGGEVIFDGDSPSSFTDKEIRKKRLHFGLVFQSFNLFPQYTALKNITLACDLMAKERSDYNENRKNDSRGHRAKRAASHRAGRPFR
jgi:polar amino acid transport system ATP-binding protein